MREPVALLHDPAPRIVDALAALSERGVVVAVPPHGALVADSGGAAELLARLVPDPGRSPLARALAGETVDEELRHVGDDGRVRDLRVRAVPVRDPAGVLVAAVAVLADVTAERRRRRADGLLVDAGRVALESLAVGPVLQAAADLMVPRLGDWCLVSTVEGDDLLHPRALAPGGLGDDASADVFPLADRAWDVLRDSQPLLAAELAAPADAPAFIRELRSGLVVPLIARGRALGVVRLFTTRRRLDRDDLELACRLAGRFALALDNARRHEEALRAGQAREDVLTVVSHDLRNPLSAINLGATVLIKKLRDAEENVAVIQRSAARIERLTENLLDLASAEAGQTMTIEREVVDARAVVEESVQLQKPLADKKGVRLVVALEFAEAPLFCDRTRIAQVFGNLLDNAIKFSASGQEVVLAGDIVDGHVRFGVTDHGPGIGDADLPHIFEPFWSTARGGKKSLGLGLSIARGIVETHDGRIWVTRDPHDATTFWFTLPLAGEAADEPPDELSDMT